MGRITDLMDYNYQDQVSNEGAKSGLVQIILGISKASIINGSFSYMASIIKRELPTDKERYPDLPNLKAFIDVMPKVISEMQDKSPMTEATGFNPIGDYIDQESIHKTI